MIMPIFPLKKVKLVVSDFHLGKGRRLSDGSQNLLEDFRSDRQFVDFLDYYMKGPYKRCDVELILNGDFFNLLQVDYRDQFTDFITEADSLHKLRSILLGHEALFKKMSEFSRESHHSLIFVLGNHDPGLLWEGVQEALREFLGGDVKFEMKSYRSDGIHVEHGNQYQIDNRYNYDRLFLTKNLPEPIINLPFGSFLCVHYLHEIKKERPYFDKVYPFSLYLRWALFHDTWFALKSTFKLVVWFLKFILTPNPARKLTFMQVIGILGQASIHPKIHNDAKRILFAEEECRIVVFGHTHQHRHIQFKPGKDYFNSGTWNERISLEVGSLGRVLNHTFVQIDFDKAGIPRGALKEWRGHIDVVEDLSFL